MARKSQPVKKPTAKQTAAQKRQTQNRREIWALVCIFLAIFSIICCFNTTAFLIEAVRVAHRGPVRAGGTLHTAAGPHRHCRHSVHEPRQASAPAHRQRVHAHSDRHRRYYHLIQGEALVWEWKVVPALFKGGIAGTTGGLLGGLLAMLLKTGITVVGAYIVLILVMLVQIITIMNMTVNSIITAIKNRPRLQKPDEEPEPEQDTAERIVNHVANRHIARVEKRRAAEFDLPVDDPPLEKAEKRKKKSRVPSPDEYSGKAAGGAPRAARPVSVTCDDVPEEPLHAAEHPVTVVPEAALPEEPVPEPAFEPVPGAGASGGAEGAGRSPPRSRSLPPPWRREDARRAAARRAGGPSCACKAGGRRGTCHPAAGAIRAGGVCLPAGLPADAAPCRAAWMPRPRCARIPSALPTRSRLRHRAAHRRRHPRPVRHALRAGAGPAASSSRRSRIWPTTSRWRWAQPGVRISAIPG